MIAPVLSWRIVSSLDCARAVLEATAKHRQTAEKASEV
jgi:hypothetical protein